MCRFLRSPVEFAKRTTRVGYLRFKQHGARYWSREPGESRRRMSLTQSYCTWSLSLYAGSSTDCNVSI